MSHTGDVRRWLVGALLALILAPAAWAQEPDPGVSIDPDSPSGREYDIPLESARRGAEPGRDRGAPVTQGRRSAPLFGAGITPSNSKREADRGTGDDGDERSESTSPAPAREATPAPRSAAPPAAVRAAATNPGAPSGGIGTTVLIGLGGLLVLAVGAGAGLLARRANRP
jgi:hypothetical protein